MADLLPVNHEHAGRLPWYGVTERFTAMVGPNGRCDNHRTFGIAPGDCPILGALKPDIAAEAKDLKSRRAASRSARG